MSVEPSEHSYLINWESFVIKAMEACLLLWGSHCRNTNSAIKFMLFAFRPTIELIYRELNSISQSIEKESRSLLQQTAKEAYLQYQKVGSSFWRLSSRIHHWLFPHERTDILRGFDTHLGCWDTPWLRVLWSIEWRGSLSVLNVTTAASTCQWLQPELAGR